MLKVSKKLVMLVTVTLVLGTVCTANAQGRRGAQGQGQGQGRGGFPFPGGGGAGRGFGGGGGGGVDLMLLSREDVRKELELVDEQQQQLQGLRDNNSMRDAFAQIRDLPREEQMAKMQELMRKSQEETKSKIEEILLPHQVDRLQQLGVQWQMQMGGGVASPALSEKLGISDDQRQKLEDKARVLEQELRKKMREELIKELTPQQQAKVKTLIGDPFEFDTSEQGMGGFGRRPQGRPGGAPGAAPGGRGGN